MTTEKEAEGAEPLTADNGGILVGRDWQGFPIYALEADKPEETQAPNSRDLGFKKK